MESIVAKMWNERKYILQQHFIDNVPEDVDDSKYRRVWTDMIDMVTDEVIECVVNQSTMGPCPTFKSCLYDSSKFDNSSAFSG